MNNTRLSVARMTCIVPAQLLALALKILNITIIWRAGTAIGDQVLLSIFAREIKLATRSRILVFTTQVDLLKLCPYADYVYPLNNTNKLLTSILYVFLKSMKSFRLVEYNFPYASFGYTSHLDAYHAGVHDLLGNPPIWKAHIAWSPYYSRLLPSSTTSGALSPPADTSIDNLISKLRVNNPFKSIGVVNPSGKITFTSVKSYGSMNYAHLVAALAEHIVWIQVGPTDSELLSNIVIDMRGLNLTAVLALINVSDLVLADEGLMNHLAGCCPKVKSFVVASGFSLPSYYSYANTYSLGSINIQSCPHSPCWLEHCFLEIDHEICKSHSVDLLAEEIIQQL